MNQGDFGGISLQILQSQPCWGNSQTGVEIGRYALLTDHFHTVDLRNLFLSWIQYKVGPYQL